MIYVKKIATVVSLAVLLASGTVYAEGTNATTAQVTQKNGKALLISAYNYLGSLQKYSVRTTIVNTVVEDGESIEAKRTSDVKVQRPDKFRIDSKGEYIDRSVYLENGQFTMMDNNEKYYATVKTGKGIDKTLEHISKKLGIILPVSTLMHSDMNKYIHPNRVQYFGTRVLSGVECNYIAFKKRKTTVHMWIENSNTPLLRAAKIVTDAKGDKGTSDMVMKWDTTPSFSDSAFVFKAPKGASNVSIKPVK